MLRIAAAALILCLVIGAAEARPRVTHAVAVQPDCVNDGRCPAWVAAPPSPAPSSRHRLAAPLIRAADPRPRAWCGWFMRQRHHVVDRLYNLARAWAHWGRAADGPCVGCLVVWPHHVGEITGGTQGHWIVLSGNDGHAVRERERSLRGVIAYRRPA